jgi:hypothetical protein
MKAADLAEPVRPLSMCVVSSAVAALSLSALEMGLIVDGEWPSCTSRAGFSCVDVVVNSTTQVSMKRRGSGQ